MGYVCAVLRMSVYMHTHIYMHTRCVKFGYLVCSLKKVQKGRYDNIPKKAGNMISYSRRE